MMRKLSLLCVLLLLLSPAARADGLIPTWISSSGGRRLQTLDAYSALSAIRLDARAPEDFHLTDSGEIFVADTGNKRVLYYNGSEWSELGSGLFSSPQGVFADEDTVYVADAKAGAVFLLDRAGNLKFSITRPSDPAFGKSTGFTPRKAAADSRGNIYVISDNSPSGVMQFNREGAFSGFTGANQAKIGLITRLQRMFYTKAQREKLMNVLPASPTNLTLDPRGVLYTVTQGAPDEPVCMFSLTGARLGSCELSTSLAADCAVDENGNILCVDTGGEIWLCDSQGEYVLSLSTRNAYLEAEGLTRSPVAVDTDARGIIYVLDKESASILRYAPTQYGRKILSALDYYSQGLYEKGEPLFNEIISLDASFRLFYSAMGSALFKRGQSAQALSAFRAARDRAGYSDALWNVRNGWILAHMTDALAVLIGIALFLALFFALRRRFFAGKEKRKLPFFLYFIRHPVDGVYELKRHGEGSLSGAAALYALFSLCYAFRGACVAYLFNARQGMWTRLPTDFLTALLPLLLMVLCTYLVATISDGEATFKQTFMLTGYSLTPYIIVTPILIGVSYILTWNEDFVYDMISLSGIVWCAFLWLSGMKEAYAYSVRGMARNVLLTAFTMLCVAAAFGLVIMLTAREGQFFMTLWGEALLRAR